AHSELDNSLGRRTSRRERKPAAKVDLGYEEPKQMKGDKLSGSSKEIQRKCEETLQSLKDELMDITESAPQSNKIDQEIKKLTNFLARKKSGSFSSKKKMTKQNSMSKIDLNRPMSDQEKKTLSRNIRNLTAPQLKGIIKIVKDMFPEKDGMLEFDIDK